MILVLLYNTEIMSINIKIGLSPCPNDTFIFYGLLNKKIDTHNFVFEPVFEDVQALNELALQGVLDVTKVSYRTYYDVRNEYTLLESGGALGHNCGPLLISKEMKLKNDLAISKIAIPGHKTTACFLLQFYNIPNIELIPMEFSEIENAILNEKVDAGVIIHENRFTYQNKGLFCIQDLGKYWEENTGYPIPLGGIIIKNEKPYAVEVNDMIQRSIAYAYNNQDETLEYCKKYAQEMDYDVMLKHINLYVNDYSKSLGVNGKNAVTYMMDKINDLEN